MKISCKLCQSADFILLENIHKKPDVEVDYGVAPDKYNRSVYQCRNCGVYFNHHDLIDFEHFYSGEYNSAIEASGLINRFNRIINLPREKSDNVQRVKRILDYLEASNITSKNVDVLDIGSGTCVFLHEIKSHVQEVHCIDPDPLAINHALNVVKVNSAHVGDLSEVKIGKKFDLITFNKVLEHVGNPIEQLKNAREFLTKNGIIYIELPEGDRIVKSNMIDKRAEFAIEHINIFNNKSMEYLAKAAGLSVQNIETITDPSGKFTIYAFMTMI